MIGRFVIRPAQDGKGDLILGALFKNQGTSLKPGVVYELREIMGELMVVELGPAALGETKEKSYCDASWMNDVNHILTVTNGRFLFTIAEVLEMQKKGLL